MTRHGGDSPETQTSPRLPWRGLPPCPSRLEIVFGGEPIVLDASGALFLPAHDALVVADLHLEKGSFLAARGNPIPRHDTRDSLARLAAVIGVYRPRAVICLGDSFHDAAAGARMTPADAALLETVMASAATWLWLTGNHDPEIPARFGGAVADRHAAGALTLAHIPEPAGRPMIAGHYHPKLSVRLGRRRTISGRCFLYDDALLLMPAFGAYAGGLDARDAALAPLFTAKTRRHVLTHGGKLWRIDPA